MSTISRLAIVVTFALGISAVASVLTAPSAQAFVYGHGGGWGRGGGWGGGGWNRGGWGGGWNRGGWGRGWNGGWGGGWNNGWNGGWGGGWNNGWNNGWGGGGWTVVTPRYYYVDPGYVEDEVVVVYPPRVRIHRVYAHRVHHYRRTLHCVCR